MTRDLALIQAFHLERGCVAHVYTRNFDFICSIATGYSILWRWKISCLACTLELRTEWHYCTRAQGQSFEYIVQYIKIISLQAFYNTG
jgi:hypothetical protein